MKRILLIVCSLLLVLSCDDSKEKKTLLDSTGILNDISVVIDNGTWEGRVGEAVRDVLASPIYGLPTDNEPTFNMNQIPTNVFSGFVKKNRTILKIEVGKSSNITFKSNVYAQPQKVITVSGKTKDDVIKLLSDNSSKIIETFKTIELKEKQRLIRKVLYNSKDIKESLGVDLEFPSFYRIAKKDDSFFWIRRDINTGSLNLIVYELPLDKIKRNDSVINQIVKVRDSIGQKYIPGQLEGSYMVTEYNYTPFHSEVILDNKKTLETKGLWDFKNGFGSGPYINYAIEDKINNRWVIIEGFIYAPSVEKRKYIFELEAIIKSIKIN